MCSVTESQYLLNLFIESNRRRMILITSTIALGLICADTLGGATGKNGSTWRPRPTIVRTHACIRHSNSELRIMKPLANRRSCVRKNATGKTSVGNYGKLGGQGNKQPLLTSQPNCVVSACTQLKNYVMTSDMKCRCIAQSSTERRTAITIIWALRHGFGYHCTISHIKCGHPGAEDTDYFCVYTNYKSLILQTKPTVGINGYKSKNHGFIKSATNSDYCTSIRQPCEPLQWRNPRHKTEKGRPCVLRKHSPSNF